MSREKVEIVRCDMCGERIDVGDLNVRRHSVLGTGYTYLPVHFYNPTYGEGYRTGVDTEQMDLCPTCADKACVIHCEVVPTEDGRSCRHVYSWRNERR